MTWGWVAVAAPLFVFTAFGGCYGVAIALWQDRGRKAIDRNGQYVHLAMMTLIAIVLLAAVPRWDDVGFDLPSGFRTVALALVAGALAGLGMYLFELVASYHLAGLGGAKSRVVLDGKTAELARPSAGRDRALVIGGLAVAVVEEVVFRGVGLLGLENAGMNPLAALGLTSAAFGITHIYFGLRNVTLKAIDGLVWGTLCLLTGTILTGIVAHLIFQAFVLRRLTRQRRTEDNHAH